MEKLRKTENRNGKSRIYGKLRKTENRNGKRGRSGRGVGQRIKEDR